MEKVRLAILIIIPIVLLAIAGIFIAFENQHQEGLSLTQKSVQVMEEKASSLKSKMDKDGYIDYLSKSIVGIRKESEEYAEDVFSFYRPTVYCLIALAFLQLVVVIQSLLAKRKKS